VIFYLLAGLISAVVTFGLSALIWKLGMRYRLYPKIRARDVHTRPTPRLGGIAMFIGMLVAFLFASRVSYFNLVFADPGPVLAILGAAVIIVFIGVADDIWELDWMTKLAGQIIAAGLLAWKGVQLTSLPSPFGGLTVGSPYMSLIFSLLAVVLVMNAVNWIDGLDGLVVGVAIIANFTFFVYSYILAKVGGQTEYFNLASLITAVLIGACIGFLPLNWHPAKLFMGDAGSMLLGLLMAASAISVTGSIQPGSLSPSQLFPAFIPIVLPLAILLVPLLDFALAVGRRLRAGISPWAADRKHLHHHLLDIGHSHFRAVLVFYSWTAVVSLGCLLFMFIPMGWVLAFIAVGLLFCTWFTLIPLTRRRLAAARPGTARPETAGPKTSGPKTPEPKKGTP